jgi:hypothetical protein
MGPTTLNSQSQSCHGDQSFALLQVAKEERSEREGEKTNLPLPMQGRETLPAYISNSGYHKYLCVCVYSINFAIYTCRETEIFSQGQTRLAACRPNFLYFSP